MSKPEQWSYIYTVSPSTHHKRFKRRKAINPPPYPHEKKARRHGIKQKEAIKSRKKKTKQPRPKP